MEVRQGEIYGFIGPNGAGKSTTIRMVMQLLRPTQGTISVLGAFMDRERPELRKKIGYLPSEIALYPQMTGKQVLELTAAAYGVKLESTPAMEFAERLQWNPQQKIKSYSLGNRKKLGIISALLHRPELLILDEPTSGLDPLIQQEFFGLLTELNREEGMTVFFSTHVLSEVEKVCGRVAFIKDGKLLRVSGPDDWSESRIHRISVQFEETGDYRERFGLDQLDPNARYDGTHHLLEAKGSIQDVLAALSALPVKELEVRRPTIEEMFLDDYRIGEVGKEVVE